MQQKRQFKGTQSRRRYFDRKINQTGNSRMIALTKVIPETWTYVRITPLRRTPESVEILIERLLELNTNAPDTTINLKNKQNT